MPPDRLLGSPEFGSSDRSRRPGTSGANGGEPCPDVPGAARPGHSDGGGQNRNRSGAERASRAPTRNDRSVIVVSER